jgi:hypothetical protein
MLQRVWTDYVDSLMALEDALPGRDDRRCESPQMLFESLDGTVVRVDGGKWRVEVFSVFTEGGETWLQLQLTGDSSHMLTLRLQDKGVADVIAIITSWLAHPADSSEILNVA